MKVYKLACITIGILVFNCNIFAKDEYYTSKRTFNYNEKIVKSALYAYTKTPPSKCEPFSLDIFDEKDYVIVAKHYIGRNKIICKKDIKKVKIEYVTISFGAISIKRQGKIISNNKEYIKIKTLQGDTFKIYKKPKRQIR